MVISPRIGFLPRPCATPVAWRRGGRNRPGLGFFRMETLQKRLRAVRRDLTQSDFASRLHTPLTTLGRYERGTNLPDLEFIINLCTIFDVSSEWLLFGRGSMHGGPGPGGEGCRRCQTLEKELREERGERREVCAENRSLNAENRRLLEENGRLREEIALLRLSRQEAS